MRCRRSPMRSKIRSARPSWSRPGWRSRCAARPEARSIVPTRRAARSGRPFAFSTQLADLLAEEPLERAEERLRRLDAETGLGDRHRPSLDADELEADRTRTRVRLERLLERRELRAVGALYV